MVDGVTRYAAYAQPGVGWIGEIPAHWCLSPLKRWARINQKTLPEQTDPRYEFDYIDIGSVVTGRLMAPPERLSFSAAPLALVAFLQGATRSFRLSARI